MLRDMNGFSLLMDALPNILGIVSFGAYIALEWLDVYVSRTFPMWTEREDNKLTRDKTGYFNTSKSVMLTAAVGAGAAAAWYFFGGYGPLPIIGFYTVYALPTILKNLKVMREHREEQFKILRNIKQYPESYRAKPVAETSYDKKEMHYAAPHFWDVRVYLPHIEREQAREELSAKMRRLAAKPESEWWKVSRMKDI